MTSPGRTLDAAGAGATVTGLLAATEFHTGDLVAGRYRIERLLGMGGMGVVYHAHDQELHVDVALKLLRPELASRPDAFERFRQELLLARQVSSPHVVRIHDLVRHGNAWLISMDFVPGLSLEKRLDTQGPLPVDDALRMTRQLALGLAAAHQRGVVHRDLKPANVLVDEQGNALITDFGVARSAGNTGITGSGVIIGTPEYLSPEQARAEPVDGRSDLYALGLLLYEMLTGTLPFRGGTPAEMLAQRIVRNPPGLHEARKDLPSFVVALCARLLELRVSQRFQRAEDVVAAIDRGRVPGLSRAQRRLAWALTSLAALAIVGLIVRGLWPASEVAETRATTGAAPLDVVPMPWVVASDVAGDQQLADGVAEFIASSLLDDGVRRSADAARVRRSLVEADYDARSARDFRDRLGQTMVAAQFLEGDLSKTDAGYRVTMRVHAAVGEATPWTQTRTVATIETLPAAVQELLIEARAELGFSGRAVLPDTPSAAQFVLAGRLRAAGAAPDAAEIAQAMQDVRAGWLWWLVLERYDQAAMPVEAATLARQARDALSDVSTPDARRASAYAQVLLGEYAAAADMLADFVAAAPGDVPARALRARALAESGDLDAALTEYSAVVRDDPHHVEAWFALGKYTIRAGDASRAVKEYLVQASILANLQGDMRLQGDVTNALGLGYKHLGRMGDAAEAFEKAARLRKTLGDARGQAVSLRNLSSVRSIQGQFDGAEQALRQARSILEPLGDVAALADLINSMGVLEEERGEFRRALDYYREALSMRQQAGAERLVAESLLNVGFSFYQVGEFDNAMVYWQQASDVYQRLNERGGVVSAQQSLGLAYTARGDFAKARTVLDASLHEAEELQMAEERAVSLANLSDLDRLEGQIARAIERAQTAHDLFDKREDPRGTVEMTLAHAAALIEVGAWDDATRVLAPLVETGIDNREQSAMLAIRQGEIALGRIELAAALSYADRAIATALQAHSYGNELAARLLRARALAAQRNRHDAQRELATVRGGLGRYGSVPLRLALAEASLRVEGAAAVASYREASAQLAKTPNYVRGMVLHALAAQVLSGAAAETARRDSLARYASLLAATPAAQHAALARWAASLGIATDPAS
jgi:tetratricopeptide (TPR) repeat protein